MFSPSHATGVPSATTCSWPRIQLNGLNSESSIHSHARALSAIGVVHGRRTRNRTIHLPRKLAVMTKPRIVASTITTTCDRIVKTMVLRRAVRNVSSAIVR